ncbi:hypothetical protein [Kitasatospora sp. NPDC048407]
MDGSRAPPPSWSATVSALGAPSADAGGWGSGRAPPPSNGT